MCFFECVAQIIHGCMMKSDIRCVLSQALELEVGALARGCLRGVSRKVAVPPLLSVHGGVRNAHDDWGNPRSDLGFLFQAPHIKLPGDRATWGRRNTTQDAVKWRTGIGATLMRARAQCMRDASARRLARAAS